MVRNLPSCARPWRRKLGLSFETAGVPWSISRSERISRLPTHAVTDYSTATVAGGVGPLVDHVPSTKPPSARPVETRKSQLIRTYTSLLRTSPVILFFQHSNITAAEWTAVRRELKKAVSAVSTPSVKEDLLVRLAPRVKLQVLRTNMFSVAFKITEFFDAEAAGAVTSSPRPPGGTLVHDLSHAAYDATRRAVIPPDSSYGKLQHLMVGPLAALVLPAISPAHMAAALSVLAPVPARFPAPTRKTSPGYYDVICQNALAKLTLVGGRVEGGTFDRTGVNWIAGIDGGLDGLRGQLVGMLHRVGLGVITTLQTSSHNIWLSLEGRRTQLQDQETR